MNPRTGLTTGSLFAESTRDDVESRIRTAQEAMATWGGLGPAERAVVLYEVASQLEADRESLARIADEETALGLERLRGEVDRASHQFRMLADFAEKKIAWREVDAPQTGPSLRRALLPIGVVAVFGASNFPFAFGAAGGDVASALAAGCGVLIKAHPAHPQTSEMIVHSMRTALGRRAVTDGLVALVHGHEAGGWLVEHPSISAVGFTGSEKGGRHLFDLATARTSPIPFYGELGSVNPVVALPGALLAGVDEFVSGYVESLTLGAGQFCTNPGLLIVPQGFDVVNKSRAALSHLEPFTLLSRGVREQLEASCRAVLQLPGADAGPRDGNPPLQPLGYRAAVVQLPIETLLDAQATLPECFGPVGVVVEYGDVDQLVEVVHKLSGCLVAAVHADEDEMADAIVELLAARAGRVVWNGWPTGVATSPVQHHGGPYPASTSAIHTSVGGHAVERFLRPVVFQNFPGS